MGSFSGAARGARHIHDSLHKRRPRSRQEICLQQWTLQAFKLPSCRKASMRGCPDGRRTDRLTAPTRTRTYLVTPQPKRPQGKDMQLPENTGLGAAAFGFKLLAKGLGALCPEAFAGSCKGVNKRGTKRQPTYMRLNPGPGSLSEYERTLQSHVHFYPSTHPSSPDPSCTRPFLFSCIIPAGMPNSRKPAMYFPCSASTSLAQSASSVKASQNPEA